MREEVLRHPDSYRGQQTNESRTVNIYTKDLANGVYHLALSSRGTRNLN